MKSTLALTALAVVFSGLVAAAEQPARKITIATGGSRVIGGTAIRQVAVSDPAVLDVNPVSTSEVFIVGLSPGGSDLLVWDKQGRHLYEVTVVAAKPIAETFANVIQTRLGIPGVTAEAAGDKVILRGQVANPDDQKRAESFAKAIYPKVESLLVLNPAREAATMNAINQALTTWKLTAELANDGSVHVRGNVEGPAAVEAIRKTLEPLGKSIRFVYDVKMTKTAQQEAIDSLNAAFKKWNLTATGMPDGRVLVEGSVPDQACQTQATKIIEDWPKTVDIASRIIVASSTTAQQVLIRARIVELDRTDIKDLGVDWSRIVFTQGSGGERTFVAADQPFIIGQSHPGPFPLFGGPPIEQLDAIGARVSALIQENKASLLSQPSLVTTSGQAASILIGGEIPVPVPQSGAGGFATITIEYKEFGIKLEVVPTVGDNGEIAMRVKPEVSALDYANGVVISGIVVPGFKTRKAETTVHVPSGVSVAIGGLLSRDEIKSVKRIPLLSQIPILGNFFKSVDKQMKDSELVIIITPEVVTCPTPSDVLADDGTGIPSPVCEPPSAVCPPDVR